MDPSTERLRQDLVAGRERIQRQIDQLRARPYPPCPSLAGPPNGSLIGAPFNANGAAIGNDALITRLTNLLQDIDDSLDELDT